MLMTGFELLTSIVESDRSTNGATTTVAESQLQFCQFCFGKRNSRKKPGACNVERYLIQHYPLYEGIITSQLKLHH